MQQAVLDVGCDDGDILCAVDLCECAHGGVDVDEVVGSEGERAAGLDQAEGRGRADGVALADGLEVGQVQNAALLLGRSGGDVVGAVKLSTEVLRETNKKRTRSKKRGEAVSNGVGFLVCKSTSLPVPSFLPRAVLLFVLCVFVRSRWAQPWKRRR